MNAARADGGIQALYPVGCIHEPAIRSSSNINNHESKLKVCKSKCVSTVMLQFKNNLDWHVIDIFLNETMDKREIRCSLTTIVCISSI